MAMMKWPFAFTVLIVGLFLCFNMSTEAREVKNEKEQVKPSHLVNMKRESTTAPPNINSEPIGPVDIDQARDTKELNASTSPAPSNINSEPIGPIDIDQARDTKELNASTSPAPSNINSEPIGPMDIDQSRDTKELNASTSSAPQLVEEYPNFWCIAKPSTPDTQLDAIIQYACTQGHAPFDCSIIQFGGSCYNPTNKVSTASVVMNLFFQAVGKFEHACHFNGSGLIIYKDPSCGSCIYPSY